MFHQSRRLYSYSRLVSAARKSLRYPLFALLLVIALIVPQALHSQILSLADVQTSLGSGLNAPYGVAVDATGNLFIADTGNNRVIEISTKGATSTVPASGLSLPSGVAVDADDNVYIADTYNSRVVKVSSSGSESPVGVGLNFPHGVAVDASGDVFIADTGNQRVVEVSAASGYQTTVASLEAFPLYVAVDNTGDLFVGADTVALEITHSGSQITLGSGLVTPTGIAVDKAGDVFISDHDKGDLVELPAGGGAQITLASGLNEPNEGGGFDGQHLRRGYVQSAHSRNSVAALR
jgi:streptogramin lyase